ncbi:MAG: S4 domain-containing protein, partial [Oscillospiraceae bacterium]
MTIISNSTDRLDLFLKLEGKTRTNIQKMIIEGKVKVNGNAVAKNYKLKINDIITVEDICEEKINLLPQSIPLDIVYEDEYLLVVNKPKGMVVHPACGNYADTLVNALLFHCNLSDCNKNDVN